MTASGKELESLVAQIEGALAPSGFSVELNVKEYSDGGKQIAEFDIVISGKVGATEVKWLIECRDRPSSGAAPGQWIEQLVGRRSRFAFDKVSAVSTTGFTEEAERFAKHVEIETRTVKKIGFEELNDWFRITELKLYKRRSHLEEVTLNLDESETAERKDAFKSVVSDRTCHHKILWSKVLKEPVSALDIFRGVLSDNSQLFDGLEPGGGEKPINLIVKVDSVDGDYFVKTEKGEIPVREFVLLGRLRITEERIKIDAINKYEESINKNEIASTVSFRFEIDGKPVGLNFLKIHSTGKTHVNLKVEK